MASTYTITVVSPASLLYESDDVHYARIPAHDGLIGVLPGHAPYVAVLGFGILTVKDVRGETEYVIDGGFVEITPERVTVLANHAEKLEDVDFAKADEELEAALAQSAEGDAAIQARHERLAAARTRIINRPGR